MVAIITGRGAGIENSSVSLLGSRGALGNAQLGRFGDSVYVNASNGNLVVTGTDEMLVGRGPDAIISRTYNSLGAWDGDNNDQWRAGVYRRVFGLTGTYGDPGSTIKRTDWDGSEQVYQWDDTKKIYWSTDGAGSYDTLKRVGTVWTWTEGPTQVTETYDDANSGRVTSRSDASGNTISYSYNGALLQRVTTSAGEYTELVYTSTNLTSLVTNAGGQVTRTTYGYDNLNRLTQVTVALDAGRVYTTTYTYDGNSNRIASITQGDGSKLTIEYDVNLKVKAVTQSVTDGEARRTSFVYDPPTVVGGATEYRTYITDAAGQTTALTHDASGNLLKVTSPPVGESGTPQVMQFTYEADGDVATVSTGPGNVVTYSYDANGNVTRERDSAGNTVERGYSADRNLLLWELRYVGTSSTSAAPSNPFQTSYVYDAYGRIRFTVSPEGRVTETRYDGFGQQSSQIIYTGSKFPLPAPSDPVATPSLSELETWVSGTAVRSEAERTDNWYDFRGNVIRSVRYATLNGYGEGGQNPATVIAGSNSTVSITPQADGIYKVTKTSGGASWTSDAHSTVRADGDFVLQIRPNQNSTSMPLVAGVSATPGAGAQPNTISHGFFFDFGRVYYYESGSYQLIGSHPYNYSANENFWLVRNGSQVSYLKGADLSSATVLRTTTINGTVPSVYFDSSLGAVGSSMDIGFTPREFVAGANVSVTELADGMTRLTRTTGGNAWNADVFGSAAATGDFALKIRPSQTNKYISVGVSSDRIADGQLKIQHGLYLLANGKIATNNFAGWSEVSPQTSYGAGDVLWLVRQGTNLRYYKGATLEQALRSTPLREVANVSGTLYFHADIYDQNGSVDVSFEPGPIASTEISRVDYLYDESGRMLSRAIAGQGIETFAYDGLGRITAATDMEGTVRNISFDDASNKTKITFVASGLVQVSAYNRAGEMTAFYEYDGEAVPSKLLGTTIYGYDELGRLIRHTDAGGVSQFYRYDALGRKTLVIDGDGSLIQYRYDTHGNLVSTTRYDDQVNPSTLASLKGDPLVFSSAANTTVTRNPDTGLYQVKKTGGSSTAWDASAREATPITGDFVMQIRPGQGNTGSAAGVSTSSTPNGIAGLSLGVVFNNNGVSYLFQGQLESLGQAGHVYYNANDSFWMVRSGSTVRFYKGDTLAAAMASGPALREVENVTGTVYGYVPILNVNAHVDVSLTPKLSDAVASAPITAGLNTSLQQVGNLTRVTKTGGGTGNWLSEARSTKAASGDFLIQIKPNQNDATFIVGVSSTPNGTGTGSVARGLYFEYNSVVYKSVNGSNTGVGDSSGHRYYAVGDTFWIERVGDTIRYYRGATIEAARAAGALAPDTTLAGTVYLDAKIHHQGASVDIAFTPDHTLPFGIAGDSLKDRTDHNFYDAAQRLIRTVDATGAVTTFDYDGMSRLVRSTQYANRLAPSASRSSLPAASPDHDRVTRNFYDKDGLLVGSLDAEGYLSEIEYDAGGRKVRASRYARQADAGLRALSDFQALLGNVKTDETKDYDIHHWWLYDARGLLRAEIDGERTLTRYTYSAAGHMVQQVSGQKITTGIVAAAPKLATLPAAGASDILSMVSWTRNLRGDALTETRALTGSTVTTTSYSYDAMGRLLSSTTQAGGLAPRTYGQVWDKQGRLIRELSPEGVARVAALGANPDQGDINAIHAQWSTAYAYDAAGRLISKVEPGGAKTVYYYSDDGALALEVNARGEVTEYAYTAFGERKAVTRHYGATLDTPRRAAIADLVGGLLGSTSLTALIGSGALSSATSTEYDRGGRVSRITTPLGGETLFEYNAFGEARLKVQALDTRSIATEFEFDRRGLLKQQLVDKTGIAISTSYGYDAFGRPRLLTNALGQQSVTEYDREGRVTSVQDAAGNITQYRYDARGNQVATTDALGNVTRHVYDKANRRIATIDPIGVLTSTSYDADGRAVMTRIHGATISIAATIYEIPENNSLLVAALGSAVSSDELVRLAYDRNGQVQYTIDGLHRVTEHVYDGRGNEVQTISYDGAINATTGAYTPTYISNQISSLLLAGKPGTSSTRAVYDAEDRLAYTIDQLGSVTWRVFDARGLLVKQVALSTRYDAGGTPSFAEVETWRTSVASSAADKDRVTRAFYDAAGRLAYAVDALGMVTKSEHDKLGNVSRQTVYAAADGTINDQTTIAWLDSKYGASITGSRVTSFAYDKLGRLEETTDPLGSVTRLSLDKLGRITASTQAANTPALAATTHYTYDSRGNIVAVKDAMGNLTRYVYDNANRRIASLNPLGALTRTTYDAAGQVIATRDYATKLEIPASTLEISAASASVQSSTTDRVTRYAYTRSGRIRFEVDGLNHVVERQYDAAGNQVGTISYDGTITVDPAGAYTSDYIAGQIATKGLASAAGTRVVRAVYDAENRVAYSIDALGQVTWNSYDKRGALTKQVLMAATYTASGMPSLSAMDSWRSTASNSEADRVTRSVYDGFGQRVYAIDEQNYVTGTEYDKRGNVSAVTRYLTAVLESRIGLESLNAEYISLPPSARQTRFNYDGTGRLIETIDPAGNSTTLELDNLGRVVTSTEAVGKSAESKTSYDYDAAGRLVRKTSAFGKPEAAATWYFYDTLGRVVATVDPDNYLVDYSYDAVGNRTWEVRHGRRVSTSIGFGTIRQGLEFSSDTEPSVMTGATYDIFGRQETATDGRGSVVRTEYDILDQVKMQRRDMNGAAADYETTSFGYDSFGNVASVTDARGNVSFTYYDKAGRVSLQVDAERFVTETGYDRVGNVSSLKRYDKAIAGTIAISAGARPAAPTDGVSVVTFVYDKRGYLKSTTDAALKTESYEVDGFGDRTIYRNKLFRPDNDTAIRYEYDKRGLLERETLPILAEAAQGGMIAVVNHYSYDERGNLTTKVEAFGAKTSRTTKYAYDPLGRVTSIQGDAVSVVANDNLLIVDGVVPTESMSYDRRGNMTSRIDQAGAETRFWYDAFGRVIASAREVERIGSDRKVALTHTFYDAAGNAEEVRQYDDLVNLNVGDLGNRAASRGTFRNTRYEYDRANRLTKTQQFGGLVGEWVGGSYVQTANAIIETTLDYDKEGNVVRESDGRGNSTWHWYDKLGREIAKVDPEGYLTVWERLSDGNVEKETRYADRIRFDIDPNRETIDRFTTVDALISYADDDASNDRITRFQYDRMGRRTQETREKVAYTLVAASGTASDETNGFSTIKYEYDGLGNVVKRVEANGDEFRYEYDRAGRLSKEIGQQFQSSLGPPLTPTTSYQYDGLNNLTSSRVHGDAISGADRVTTYVYAAAGGRLSSVTDATAFEREYLYDRAGRKVVESYVRVKADAPQSVKEALVTRYDMAGRVVFESHARRDGAAWVFANETNGAPYDATHTGYNAHGEVTGRGVTSAGAAPEYQENFEYDQVGRVWRSNAGDDVSRLYLYDKAGNQTLTLQSRGADFSGFTLSNYGGLINASGEIAANGTVTAANAAVTISRYDRRGQVTLTREPGRSFLSANASNTDYSAVSGGTIFRGRSFNAFGEVASETDARGYDTAGNLLSGFTTYFTYNSMGRMIAKVSPSVDTYREDGAKVTLTPTETYGYDLSGRLVSVRDANSHASGIDYRVTRILLAGTGHRNGEALVSQEFRPEQGMIQTYYDVFGDARQLVNELLVSEFRNYDGVGRITSILRRGGELTDTYAYDGLGQRIRTGQSWFVSGQAQHVEATTDYDAKGRVVRHVAIGGDTTLTSYVWNAGLAIKNASDQEMGSKGGWVTTTLYQNGRSSITESDLFGRAIKATDLGGHETNFLYDRSGSMVSRSVGGQVTSYRYDTSGRLIEMMTGTGVPAQGALYDVWRTTYGYDRQGNKAQESYRHEIGQVVTTDDGWGGQTSEYNATVDILQNAKATYDALNRIVSWSEANGNYTRPDANTLVKYDASGNVRSTSSTYVKLNGSGGQDGVATQEYWYLYDWMNRVTLDKGILSGGQIIAGAQGIEIGYDQAGRRSMAKRTVTATGQVTVERENPNSPYGELIRETTNVTYTALNREEYEYDAQGRLIAVKVAQSGFQDRGDGTFEILELPETGQLKGTWGYDVRGRLLRQTDYTADSSSTNPAVAFERSITQYNAKDQVIAETLFQRQGEDLITTFVTNNYGEGTQYHLGSIVSSNSTVVKGTTTQFSSTTTNEYTWYSGAAIQTTYYNQTGQAQTNSIYNYSPAGVLNSVVVSDGRQRTINFINDGGGLALGRDELSSASTNPRELWYRFDGREMGYIGNNGTLETDYLASIANRTAVSAGGAFRNGSQGGAAYADFDQGVTPITSFDQGGVGGSYTVRAGDTLQGIAAAMWGDANLWYELAGANGLSGGETLVAGQVLRLPGGVSRSTYSATTFTPYDPNAVLGDTSPTTPLPKAAPKKNGCGFFGQILSVIVAVASSYFFGPLVGNLISQGFNNIIGTQKGFSFASLALTVVAAGINKGLSGLQVFGSATTGVVGVANEFARGAISNALTQGVAITMRLQNKFDFAGVAAAGVVSAAGGLVSRAMDTPGGRGTFSKSAGFGNQLVSGLVSGVAGAATRSLISRTSFGDNVMAVLPDVIGSTLARAAAGELMDPSNAPGRGGRDGKFSLVERILSFGYMPSDFISEGVAYGVSSVERFVSGLKMSQGEREFIRTARRSENGNLPRQAALTQGVTQGATQADESPTEIVVTGTRRGDDSPDGGRAAEIAAFARDVRENGLDAAKEKQKRQIVEGFAATDPDARQDSNGYSSADMLDGVQNGAPRVGPWATTMSQLEMRRAYIKHQYDNREIDEAVYNLANSALEENEYRLNLWNAKADAAVNNLVESLAKAEYTMFTMTGVGTAVDIAYRGSQDKLEWSDWASAIPAIGSISRLSRLAKKMPWGLTISETKIAFSTAQKEYKGSTVIGHALSKHVNRIANQNQEVWGPIGGAMKTWNDQGMRHMREIIRAPGEFKLVKNEHGIVFLEKHAPDGRGLRLNRDGTFKGFID